jgi:predicted enzyme related to lactoylglutathione lyase
MRRPSTAVLVVLALALLGGATRAEENAKESHGVFTGQIKPVLYVSDVEKSVPFYRDVLGFDFEGFANRDGKPYYGEMAAAGVKFGLHEPLSDSQAEKVGRERLYFRVENLERHRARVLAWGGTPGEIKETAWMNMFVVKDPDGNEIVFAVTDPKVHSSDPWSTH